MLPLSVDGLVIASALAMLDSARRGPGQHWLPRLSLSLGVLATLAANVAYGWAHLQLGPLVSAWPAIALVLTFEVLTVMIRRAAARPGLAAPGVTGHDLEVARFREYLERGKVPGIKAIKTELRVGQPKAREVRERLRDVLSVDG